MADVTYQRHNGVSSTDVGVGPDIPYSWGVYFEVDQANGSLITELEFGFGRFPAGDEVVWRIFTDTDADPTNGGLVERATGTWTIISDNHILGNGFGNPGPTDRFPISPIDVSGDTFLFVTGEHHSDDFKVFESSIALSKGGNSPGANWENHGGSTANDWKTGRDLANLALSGNWIVTAYGIKKQTILGDVNQDGLVNLLDVEPFVGLLTNGAFQIEADINLDGVVNLLDVSPFVDLLTN